MNFLISILYIIYICVSLLDWEKNDIIINFTVCLCFLKKAQEKKTDLLCLNSEQKLLLVYPFSF